MNVSITGRYMNAYTAVILCIKGFCFSGRGGALARVSIEGVNVAVKRQVCRSLGRTLNR